jgi:hypothetical protein
LTSYGKAFSLCLPGSRSVCKVMALVIKPDNKL